MRLPVAIMQQYAQTVQEAPQYTHAQIKMAMIAGWKCIIINNDLYYLLLFSCHLQKLQEVQITCFWGGYVCLCVGSIVSGHPAVIFCNKFAAQRKQVTSKKHWPKSH